MKIRHPEKVNKPINPLKKKPEWIRSKLVNSQEFFLTKSIVNQHELRTVCQEANCPNITKTQGEVLIRYSFRELIKKKLSKKFHKISIFRCAEAHEKIAGLAGHSHHPTTRSCLEESPWWMKKYAFSVMKS